jgi:hypothetical protein
MTPDDEGLAMLREAVRIMRARSDRNPLDPTGWLTYGALHSVFCATTGYAPQVHYSWLFLPWHRAYLAALEKQLQAAINEPSLALVYWDWTRTPRIPAAYWGAGNPLHDPTRLQRPTDAIPADFTDVGPALRARKTTAFHGFPKLAAGDPDPLVEGTLENGVHNNVHNWIGGNMAGFPTASVDPIFTAHHGQLDRMWAAWRAAGGASGEGHRDPEDRRWLDTVFTFHGPTGRPTRVAVRDCSRPSSSATASTRSPSAARSWAPRGGPRRVPRRRWPPPRSRSDQASATGWPRPSRAAAPGRTARSCASTGCRCPSTRSASASS